MAALTRVSNVTMQVSTNNSVHVLPPRSRVDAKGNDPSIRRVSAARASKRRKFVLLSHMLWGALASLLQLVESLGLVVLECEGSPVTQPTPRPH